MKRIIAYTFTLMLFWGLVGCDAPAPQPSLTVDPVFREFYARLGGEEILGPPISPVYEEKGRTQQFTSKALLVYDPAASRSMQFYLMHLGREIISLPDVPSETFEVYSGFLEMYRQLGGARYVGRPLTSVQVEPEYRRITQYFENLGFYQLESDPPDVVHLLDYGAWKCADFCSYQSPKESVPRLPEDSTTGGRDSNFNAAIERLNPDLSGAPLTSIYPNPTDGKLEIIFENIVPYEDPASANGVSLRPLPALLGIPPDPPHQGSTGTDGIFITTGNNLGYDVPEYFDDYIKLNGGYDFIGKPISNYKQITNNLYRQCFENLCLDYHTDEPEAFRIQPMALGRRYRQQQREAGNAPDSLEGLTIEVWESNHLINSTQTQTIYALVRDSGIPLYNIDLSLTVTLPDGSQQTALFPPTNSSGQTSLTIGPFAGQNSDVFTYEVCVENIMDDAAPDCALADFLIWGNP